MTPVRCLTPAGKTTGPEQPARGAIVVPSCFTAREELSKQMSLRFGR